MGKMVSHLKGLPGPGAHSPRLQAERLDDQAMVRRAIAELDDLDESSQAYKDSTLIMQALRDNMDRWRQTSGYSELG